jgi:developmental checkpoint coupling sporulation initiation to replication initiation
MQLLQDKYLIECYFQAIELNLEEDFVRLLLFEIKRRNIDLTQYNPILTPQKFTHKTDSDSDLLVR